MSDHKVFSGDLYVVHLDRCRYSYYRLIVSGESEEKEEMTYIRAERDNSRQEIYITIWNMTLVGGSDLGQKIA